MRLVLNNLKIELENQQEIKDFWNVILFSLDLHAEREKEGRPCMHESELKLAKRIADILENSWDY